MSSGDTIFALSSGAPPAAIAVMRISGPAAGDALQTLAGPVPMPRRAMRRTLRDAAGAPLDDALVLWMPGPGTATGEDVVELHLHGGRAVVAAVDRALLGIAGLRPAVAGEFTRRALMNGVIDLSQAEGLADLLSAETEAQRRAALHAAEGGIAREIGGWLDRLTTIAAIIEAELDYGDEIEGQGGEDPHALLRSLIGDMSSALDRPPVERLRDGARVVLAGPPNSGKSSLINALASRDVSIVSPLAGTTRDVVETTVVRDGRIYVLSDTAGLVDDSKDPIERAGIERAQHLINDADLLLWLGDEQPPREATWLYPRADVRGGEVPPERICVSIHRPGTVQELWRTIANGVDDTVPVDVALYNGRERAHVTDTWRYLHKTDGETDCLIIAELVRQAREALSQVSNASNIEHLLDALFGRFCVGK